MIDKANETGIMNHGIVRSATHSARSGNKRNFQETGPYVPRLSRRNQRQTACQGNAFGKSINDVINPYAEYEVYEKIFG